MALDAMVDHVIAEPMKIDMDDCFCKKIELENDPVNHPSHYTSGTIECIDFIDSCGYGLDFCLANAIKYLTRCKLKGTCEQDIRKAIWYATHAADGLKEGKYSIE